MWGGGWKDRDSQREGGGEIDRQTEAKRVSLSERPERQTDRHGQADTGKLECLTATETERGRQTETDRQRKRAFQNSERQKEKDRLEKVRERERWPR